jgi:aspartyl-tRNA(Asn)/glutamyl-tRNA(Gln) amidotransferase subunit C
MAKITRDDVLKLAHLARLELSEEEIAEFRGELSEILGFVEKLNELDTDGLEPTHQVTGLTNVWREDEIRDYGYEPAVLLENVIEVKDNQIVSKRMIG